MLTHNTPRSHLQAHALMMFWRKNVLGVKNKQRAMENQLRDANREMAEDKRMQKWQQQEWDREKASIIAQSEDRIAFYRNVTDKQSVHVFDHTTRECEICYHELEECQFVQFPCMHSTCCRCAIRALRQKNPSQCHLCKTEYTPENCVQVVNLTHAL